MDRPRSTVSAIMVVAGEPSARLLRAATALADQRDAAVLELIVATPPDDLPAVRRALNGVALAVHVVTNPGGKRSPGLNRALAKAQGEVICRVDARSVLPADYVAQCVARLRHDASVGVVGGTQCPVAGGSSVTARGISRALGNPWALGGAAYRSGRTGPADTVYLGVFRRGELVRLGGWDERLDANEDYELCGRYRAAGLGIWVEGGLDVPYEARATLGELARQYRAFGQSKVEFWRRTGGRPVARQQLALAGAAGAGVLAMTAVARQPRVVLGLVLGAAVGLVGLDTLGGDPGAQLSERVAATPAYLTVWSAWLWGIVAGMVGGRLRVAEGREGAGGG